MPRGLEGARVLLGVSGGIAAYKAVLVTRLLVKAGAVVDVVPTRGALRFVGAPTFEGITGHAVRTEVWDGIEDDTHVALARAADVVGVYPATAHTLARAAAGLADDLLTTSLLATTAPVVVAPAMHTEMWQHAATQASVARLVERGVEVVGPVTGALMGGDSGAGRVVEPEAFVAALAAVLAPGSRGGAHTVGSRALDGVRVLVTAGGTREPLDPVRFLGNRSSGKMGFAVARVAAARGARVDLVAAPTHLATPSGVARHDVVSARDLQRVVHGLRAEVDVIVKAAAVADFRPADTATDKLKKADLAADGPPTVTLVPNPDILAGLGAWRREHGLERPLLVGFAAETRDVVAHARAKLERKGADLLVANDVSADDAGFGSDDNRVVLLRADGSHADVDLATKDEVAGRILDEVAGMLAAQDRAGVG